MTYNLCEGRTMKVAIIMGSNSDYPTLKHTEDILEKFGVEYHSEVVSAHRTPDKMYDFAKKAKELGYCAIIAGAGGAAHLPGMVASLTTLPVIGVPIETQALKGIDSLLSINQMPGGVPVATMAIGKAGAINAGLFAVRLIGTIDSKISERLNAFEKEQIEKVDNMKLER